MKMEKSTALNSLPQRRSAKYVEQWSRGLQDGITTLFMNGEKIAEVPSYVAKNMV